MVEETPERGWLPQAKPAPRRGVLEDTLFRRLEDLRRKPSGDLVDLVERTLEVLRATKEALLEQRQEIRSLAAGVETLRTRVDRLAQSPLQSSAPPPVMQATPAEPAPPTELPAAELPAVAPSTSYVLMVGLSTGYQLVAGDGSPPATGDHVSHDGVVFEVVGSKRSAIPGETGRVVFALPVGSES